MAHLFALLLGLMQAPPPAATNATPISFDARWVTAFETPAATAPGFDADGAYVPLKGGELVAVNLNRGTIRWRLESETAFTPATGDGLVFTVSGHTIEARDRDTGATRWQTALPGGPAAPLYYDTGWLIASTTAGDLAAFRASDGTLVWRRQFGSPIVGPPGPALDRLFLPLADNRLVAVLLVNGDTVWERTLSAPIRAMLTLDEQLIVGTASKDVMSIDVSRGQLRWSRRLGGDMAGTPTADDKRIYYASRDNMLSAVDRRSGNLRWNAPLSSRPAGGPLRIPIGVVMPLVSSQILGFDPATGKTTVTASAAGEIGVQPYVRRETRQTEPVLITVSRDGQLQGFGRRFEPVPQMFADLPGTVTSP